jgi:hypothetical protein
LHSGKGFVRPIDSDHHSHGASIAQTMHPSRFYVSAPTGRPVVMSHAFVSAYSLPLAAPDRS